MERKEEKVSYKFLLDIALILISTKILGLITSAFRCLR